MSEIILKVDSLLETSAACEANSNDSENTDKPIRFPKLTPIHYVNTILVTI